MKLLPILLLTFVLSVGEACSSEPEPAVPPTATPDVSKYSRGEVIGLVQGMLRTHGDETCISWAKERMSASYLSKGRWKVDSRVGRWYVYEGTNAIETDKGRC